LWLAVERHAVSALEALAAFFTSPAAWKSGIVRDIIVERLMRRWIAEGSEPTYDACAQFLASAPDPQQRHRLLAAIEQGFHHGAAGPVTFGSGGLFANTEVPEVRTNTAKSHFEHLTPALSAQLDSLWQDDPTDHILIRVCSRTGRNHAVARASACIEAPHANT